MSNFSGLSANSGLSDVLSRFQKNTAALLQLLNSIMCADGELARGEREAIAAYVSGLNNVPYCIFYHTMFSEVFSGPIEATNARISPLTEYARCLCEGTQSELNDAFTAALDAGWSEQAVYEVVEICGVFNFVNGIVRAADLAKPAAAPDPRPTAEGLKDSYLAMAGNIERG
ncbi:carboxymuconolactone decarboxylase family protein [Hoeflea poritis]|uniref:Alkylhydroperoxidase n=1 Tax=Hoeflea poritis TaxID=2993659 RepID=A0ABT4VQN2_9HYPH|nr:hypothetical protein [Hoeflea poritis]MDA4847023.1 hypothetical protein [Hoeflea poritis]